MPMQQIQLLKFTPKSRNELNVNSNNKVDDRLIVVSERAVVGKGKVETVSIQETCYQRSHIWGLVGHAFCTPTFFPNHKKIYVP